MKTVKMFIKSTHSYMNTHCVTGMLNYYSESTKYHYFLCNLQRLNCK